MRYIDADKLIFKLNGSQVEFDEFYKGLVLAKQITDDIPSENIRPVVRGRWIEKKAKDGQRYLQCSVCGRNKMDMTYDDFCKYCGANMREVEE